jgi:hypothetical protein
MTALLGVVLFATVIICATLAWYWKFIDEDGTGQFWACVGVASAGFGFGRLLEGNATASVVAAPVAVALATGLLLRFRRLKQQRVDQR